jgi:hypothetical protein
MSDQIVREIAPPPEAQEHGGQEILRGFIVDGDLHVSLQHAFDRPAVWGVLLVDIARHVARMYSKSGDMHEAQALDEIYRNFQAEWTQPTDEGHTDTMN